MANTFEFPTSVITGNGVDTVTAYNEAEGRLYQANEFHPHWEGLLEGLSTGDPEVWELFDVVNGIKSRFKQVSDRIAYDGDQILFDGDPVHSVLADQLQRAIEDGNAANYNALAKFWEKLESNPNEHSRAQAYDWLAAYKFQITEDGDVVAYKYVNKLADGTYASVAASQVPDKPSGFVNGVAVPPLSVVPQKVGDVVTMPRSEVAHDPREACKAGLHVGTWNYVGGETRPHVLEVHVNPRDFVSIPNDGGGQKARVCRYVVAGVNLKEEPTEAPVLRKQTDPYTWTPDVSYRA